MKSLLLFLLFLPLPTQAQTDWVAPGASWYYFYTSFWTGQGYETLAYEQDSVIQNRACKGLKQDLYYVGNFQGDTVHEDRGYLWIHQEGDTLWKYDFFLEDFVPLYQLGRAIGDTLDYFQGTGWDAWDIVVMDTGSVQLNGLTLQSQTLGAYRTNSPDPGPELELEVVEKIGFLTYPFGFLWDETAPNLVDGPERAVLCYWEDGVAEVLLGNQPCVEWFVPTSAQAGRGLPQINVSPNPMTDQVRITTSEQKPALEVFDATGQLVFRADQLPNEALIPVAHWLPGLYLFQFRQDGKLLHQRLIKPH
ncbi:MAG: T9SS type A sorting domain-containing protein [Bacteroidota bacterium]